MSDKQYRKHLNEEMATALNDHVTVEARAAFMYYALASWAAVRGLIGFADYFKGEAAGELDHMRQFVDYLNDRDFQATFHEIPPPRTDFGNAREAFEVVCDAEHRLCDSLDTLIELAHRNSDHLSDSFLHQFVPQQIADTSESDDILDRLKLVGDDGHGILLLDQELSGKSAG